MTVLAPWLVAGLGLLACIASLAGFRRPGRTERGMVALLLADVMLVLAAFVAPLAAWSPLVPFAGAAVVLFAFPVPPPPSSRSCAVAPTGEPPWWPEFEAGFRRAVRERESERGRG